MSARVTKGDPNNNRFIYLRDPDARRAREFTFLRDPRATIFDIIDIKYYTRRPPDYVNRRK